MRVTIVPIIHQQLVARVAANTTNQTLRWPLLSQAQGSQSDAGEGGLKHTHEGAGSPLSLHQQFQKLTNRNNCLHKVPKEPRRPQDFSQQPFIYWHPYAKKNHIQTPLLDSSSSSISKTSSSLPQSSISLSRISIYHFFLKSHLYTN